MIIPSPLFSSNSNSINFSISAHNFAFLLQKKLKAIIKELTNLQPYCACHFLFFSSCNGISVSHSPFPSCMLHDLAPSTILSAVSSNYAAKHEKASFCSCFPLASHVLSPFPFAAKSIKHSVFADSLQFLTYSFLLNLCSLIHTCLLLTSKIT